MTIGGDMVGNGMEAEEALFRYAIQYRTCIAWLGVAEILDRSTVRNSQDCRSPAVLSVRSVAPRWIFA